MSRLFTLNDSRPQHPDVRQWLREQSGPLAPIAAYWFAALRACGDDVNEVMHDGQATACVDGAAFAYVARFQSHVNIGFFDGAALPDPRRLLQGSGRFMRHVRVSDLRDGDEGALQELVREAYASVKEALARAEDEGD